MDIFLMMQLKMKKICFEAGAKNLWGFILQVYDYLPFIRQIWRGKKCLSQKSGSCRIDFKQNTQNLLE